jgi:tRNA threonylcarbamoyladenosine biosynthesis protein TsaB
LSNKADVKLLCIDTSTTACSLALTDNGRFLAECLINLEKPHSAILLQGLALVMKNARLAMGDIDALGVTLGPGSFTGLRVGIATVKGLALATDRPVVGFSSLAMLAMNLPYASYPVCPMLDARKGEVYTALYRCRELPEPIVEDCVVSPADFLDRIREPVIFVGSGAVRYRDLIVEKIGDLAQFAPSVCHQPRASAGALLATDSLSKGEVIPRGELAPVYLRLSEAELSQKKKEMDSTGSGCL